MKRTAAIAAVLTLSGATASAQLMASNEPERRAQSGAAATRAVALCSGLWSGNQTMEMLERDNPNRQNLATVIDRANRTVSVTYSPAMPPRHVVWRPVLGCAQLPAGASLEAARALPRVAPSITPPNFDAQPWPMGDQNATGTLPPAQRAALDALVDKAFDGTTYAGRTWAVLIVKDGRIVAERYAMGFDMHKGAQTHSAAKSFASTVAGIVVRDFGMDMLKKPALREWDHPVDPRREVTAELLLRMTGGFGAGEESSQQDIYNGGATVAGRAVNTHLDAMPGTRFLYNPPETMLLLRSARQAVNNDPVYWALPFERLFWKIGMTRTTPASDWNGDFLMSGQTYSTARDFARFGLLYLNKGRWNGEQIVPEDWVRYVTTPGPVQPAGTGPRYGGQFWLYGGQSGLPADAFSPNGGQGQYAMTIPSRGVVVVRRGYDAGGTFQIARFSADVLKVFE